MRCPDCQQEWTPPPDACPHCAPEEAPPPKFNAYILWSILILPIGGVLGLVTESAVVVLLAACVSLGLVIYGMVETRRFPERTNGFGCGFYPILIILVMLAVLWPVFHKSRVKPQGTSCISNQRQVAWSILLYAQENGEVLPIAITMKDLSIPAKVLRCPARRDIAIGYGYNQALQGRKMNEFPRADTMLVTADGGNKAHLITGLSDIVTTRHKRSDKVTHPKGYAVTSYLDGHMENVTAEEVAALRLRPADRGK